MMCGGQVAHDTLQHTAENKNKNYYKIVSAAQIWVALQYTKLKKKQFSEVHKQQTQEREYC